MNTPFVTVILTIVSALTFVAYKHPTAYSKVGLFIMFFCIALLGVMHAFNFGVDQGISAAVAATNAAAKNANIENTLRLKMEIPSLPILILSCAPFYLFLLSVLPDLGITHKTAEKSD